MGLTETLKIRDIYLKKKYHKENTFDRLIKLINRIISCYFFKEMSGYKLFDNDDELENFRCIEGLEKDFTNKIYYHYKNKDFEFFYKMIMELLYVDHYKIRDIEYILIDNRDTIKNCVNYYEDFKHLYHNSEDN